MKILLALLVAPLFALIPALAWGGEAVPTAQDPVREERAVRLAGELRCLVCQNQSLADSNAELAVDLRRQIREQVSQGRSDGEIIDFMVQRYGDFVLYRPPVKATTLLLWFGPALLLLIGGGVLARNLARRRKRAAEQPLSEDERERVRRILGAEQEKDRA